MDRNSAPERMPLSRRDLLLGGVGLFGAMALGACTSDGSTSKRSGSPSSSAGGGFNTAVCVVTPEQTEGPFYLDGAMVRRDITEGRPGAPLEIEFVVVDATACRPMPNVAVDIWHCDALGEYSGYGPNAQGAPGHLEPVNAARFFRGTQITDDQGLLAFRTIVPGWYSGRAVHIHVKVHPTPTSQATTQVYFTEALLNSVYAKDPYSAHAGAHIPFDQDSTWNGTKGPAPLTLAKSGSGYRTSFTLGIAG